MCGASDIVIQVITRTISPLFLAAMLPSCQMQPTEAELLTSMRENAVAFVTAMDRFDFKAAKKLVEPAATEYFEILEQMYSRFLLVGNPSDRPSATVSVVSAERQGDRGLVELTHSSSREDTTVLLRLVRVGSDWGAEGWGRRDGVETRNFADREARARKDLQRAIENAVPDPELGPIVESFFAAAERNDLVGMTANMTEDCKQREGDSDQRFTRRLASGDVSIDRWQFHGHTTEGGLATQRLRVSLINAESHTTGEQMEFVLVKNSNGWQINEIR